MTYIRSLAKEIALSLQSLAFVVELQRIEVGLFSTENAVKLSCLDLIRQKDIKDFFVNKSIKIEAVLDDMLVLNITSDQARKIFHGQKCYFDQIKDIDLIWIKYNEILLAIGSIKENCFNSFRVFNLIKMEIDDVDYSRT